MDPDNLPNCSDCGDVIMYCKCIEKLNDENFKMFMNGKKCPKCSKKDSIVPIVYGYPSPEMIDDFDEGNVSLGGCSISDANPDYECNACGNKWSKAYYDR